MKIIGICGSSGSGKSSVCQILRSRGIPILDCDVIYHDLINARTPCLVAIGEEFGFDLIIGDKLDRGKLRNIVFRSPKKIATLNKISHKFVKDELKRKLCELKDNNASCCVIDAPMFFEANLDSWCDFICAVLTDRGIQMKRICDRDGITPEQAKQRLDNQLSNDFLVSKVDFVIHNDKDREHLVKECDQMLEAVKQSDIKRKEIL